MRGLKVPKMSVAAATTDAAPMKKRPSGAGAYGRVRLTEHLQLRRRLGGSASPSLSLPPPLLLAPMERLGDAHFRGAIQHAITHIRGPDGKKSASYFPRRINNSSFTNILTHELKTTEMCTEFMRVPEKSSNFESAALALARSYDALELAKRDDDDRATDAATGTPLAFQIMGGDAEKLAHVARLLASPKKLAAAARIDEAEASPPPPRIDLNCGCPANLVTGKGAGSSLLRTPEVLHDIVRAMVNAATESANEDYVSDEAWAACAASFAPRVSTSEGIFDDAAIAEAVRSLPPPPRVPVSVKMRSGFDDTSLFVDNLLAAQEAGASFVTIHPRTKREGYKPEADWSLIAKARDVLHIPVVGNGDVTSLEDARRLLAETGADGIMIGRGAAIDPFVFQRVRSGLCGSDDIQTDAEEAEMLVQMLRWHVDSIARAQKNPDARKAQIARIDRMKLLGKFLLHDNANFRDNLLRQPSSEQPSADAFEQALVALLRSEWRSHRRTRQRRARVNTFSGDRGRGKA